MFRKNYNFNKTFFQLNEETNKRLEKLKELGYNVLYIWESEFNKLQKHDKNVT